MESLVSRGVLSRGERGKHSRFNLYGWCKRTGVEEGLIILAAERLDYALSSHPLWPMRPTFSFFLSPLPSLTLLFFSISRRVEHNPTPASAGKRVADLGNKLPVLRIVRTYGGREACAHVGGKKPGKNCCSTLFK